MSDMAYCSSVQVRVEIESLADGVDLSEPLTRARFEELNSDLFKKTLGPVKKAMEDADLKKVRACPLPRLSWDHFLHDFPAALQGVRGIAPKIFPL
jgi:hypothetical protein